MKTFSISSLGCKVNHYESQQVRQALEHLGLAQLVSVTGRHGRDEGGNGPPSSPDGVIRPNVGLQIKPKDASVLHGLPTLTRFEGQTRAFLKVQDGTDDFRRVIALVTTGLDRPAVTTDVIVGFPGETDADFERTMSLARQKQDQEARRMTSGEP